VIRGPLERWHEAGTLPDVPDPDVAAVLFVEMVASIPRVRALLGRPLKKAQVERLVTSAVELFLRGCGYEEED
jgi:hypothetical protein